MKNLDCIDIQTQSELLMTRIREFFSSEENVKRLVDVLTGKSSISLRIIDWFVTNYSKKNDIIYIIHKSDKNNIYDLEDVCVDDIYYVKFIVFLEYKSQLKAYSKKQFDSFCRGERIRFQYRLDGQIYEIETTVGQLNFFRWAIENNIFVYIYNNYTDIENDMNVSIQNKKCQKKDGDIMKRVMYNQPGRAYQRQNFKVLVHFN